MIIWDLIDVGCSNKATYQLPLRYFCVSKLKIELLLQGLMCKSTAW